MPDLRAPEPSAILIDARGHRCPVPTLRLQKALREAPGTAVFVLLADDPLARIDVPHFAGERGLELEEARDAGGWIEFRLRRLGEPQ